MKGEENKQMVKKATCPVQKNHKFINKKKKLNKKQIVEMRFDSYIKKIVKNEMNDFYRAKKYVFENELDYSDADIGQIQNVEKTTVSYFSDYYWIYVKEKKVGVKSQALYDALMELNELQLYILISLYIDEESQEHVAKKLNISRGSVRYQNNKAIYCLRKNLCLKVKR